MVLKRVAWAFRGTFPREGRRGGAAGGQPDAPGRPPEPSWRERLARLAAWALAATAIFLFATATMLARHGALSRRQWLHASRLCHRLQHAALRILRGTG